MTNPLDDWQSNIGDQKAVESFFSGETGQRLLNVLRFINRPIGSAAAGNEGVVQDARLFQNHMGFQKCLDAVPTLFFSFIVASRDQQEKRGQIATAKAFTKPK